jgi:hypothetical protein
MDAEGSHNVPSLWQPRCRSVFDIVNQSRLKCRLFPGSGEAIGRGPVNKRASPDPWPDVRSPLGMWPPFPCGKVVPVLPSLRLSVPAMNLVPAVNLRTQEHTLRWAWGLSLISQDRATGHRAVLGGGHGAAILVLRLAWGPSTKDQGPQRAQRRKACPRGQLGPNWQPID